MVALLLPDDVFLVPEILSKLFDLRLRKLELAEVLRRLSVGLGGQVLKEKGRITGLAPKVFYY